MEEMKILIDSRSLKKLVIGRNTYRSAFDLHLSKDDLVKSSRDLKETEEVRHTSLQKLKELLSRDKEIRYRTDDDYLIRYLRYKKFDYKEAYRILHHYYVTRTEYAALLYIPRNIKSLLCSRIWNIMPYRDEEGRVIFLLKIGNWNTDEFNVYDMIRLFVITWDIISMNPHIQISGFIGIWDFTDTTTAHISQVVNPRMLRLWTKFMQEMYPYRLNRIILFNCNTLLHACFNTVRFFLKKKIAERVIVMRSDLNKLHEYVNPSLLPKEYGGNLEDSDCYSYSIQPILDNMRYLMYESSFFCTKGF